MTNRQETRVGAGVERVSAAVSGVVMQAQQTGYPFCGFLSAQAQLSSVVPARSLKRRIGVKTHGERVGIGVAVCGIGSCRYFAGDLAKNINRSVGDRRGHRRTACHRCILDSRRTRGEDELDFLPLE